MRSPVQLLNFQSNSIISAHKRAGGLGVKIGKLKKILLLLPQRLIEKAQVKKTGIFDTNAQVRPNYGGTISSIWADAVCRRSNLKCLAPTPVAGVIKKVSECSNRRKIVKMAYAKEPVAAATFRV